MSALRKRRPAYYFILLFIVVLQGTSSCKKDNGLNAQAPPVAPTATLSQTAVSPGNLLSNSSFDLWDSSSNLLRGWSTTASQHGVITRDSGGIKFEANVPGSYYIYQKVKLDARKFYQASVTTSYAVNNYFFGGIYMMDSSLHHILGKFEVAYSSATGDKWNIIFYNKMPTTVAIVIGFFNGINARAIFKNALLDEYHYTPRITSSAFSNYLNLRQGPLVFSARQFDQSVNNLAEFVNSILLCRYAYYSDSAQLPVVRKLIGDNPQYGYFNQYLDTLANIQIGYCQKSSLSLGEILGNEFNIPTRQMFMVFGPVGKHQFLEYWNPFASRWIIIDPCFNVRYAKDSVLLGTDDFDRSVAPQYMQTYGTHFYYTTTDDLIWFWQNMDFLQVMDGDAVSFPYSSENGGGPLPPGGLNIIRTFAGKIQPQQ
jgi:hypothetical protein